MRDEVKLPSSHIARVGLLLACACLVLPTASVAEDFDRTIAARPGTRLDVRLYGGEVVVHAWDRDSVRVRATHFRTDRIDLRTLAQAIEVRAHARAGVPHAIDLDIAVPAWMSVAVKGTYVEISVQGTRGSITAETVRGDVRVTGGAGTIALKSIEGEVVLEGGTGRAELSAVNNGIRVARLAGDLFAETVNGSVKLEGIESTSVEVGTVGGDLSWDGPMAGKGRYQFATHNGDIDITLPARDDATVSVRAFEGRFRSTFPVKLPDERARRKRFSFTLGAGTARLDLETFGGVITLRRATGS